MRRRFVLPVFSSVPGAGLASITSARMELESITRPGGDVTGEPCDSTTAESKKRKNTDFIEGPGDEEMERMMKK